jgi:hypothetical protein
MINLSEFVLFLILTHPKPKRMRHFISILFLLFTLSSAGQVNLSNSLTACYALNGNANDPVSSLNGSLSSVTPTVDRFNTANSAYAFSGSSSSYIQLPNSPLIKANSVSFSAWVRVNTLNSAQYLVFAHNGCGSYHEGYMMSCENQGLGYNFRIGRSNSICGSLGQIIINSTTLVNAQTWYHVGFYIGSDSLKLYVNGTLESAVVNANPIAYNALTNVYLGGSNQAAAYAPLNGSMDNVRFYNRKLNGNEFNQLYTLDPVCVAIPTGTIPSVAFSVSSVSLCAGGSVSMTDQSSFNPTAWNWQIPGANPPSSNAQNPLINFPNSGTYTVSLVSSNTVGASNTATQSIVVLPNPNISVVANSSSLCIGQNTNLYASGASSFTWSTLQNGSSINVAPISNTIYTVTGADNSGCTNTGSVLVTVSPLPTVTAIASKTVICRGQNSTLVGNGAITYTWSTQQSTASIVVSPQSNTTYTLTGTNSSGCKNSATVSVAVSDCVGLNEMDMNSDFSAFPNPNNGNFEIKFSGSNSGTLFIYNALSELVYQIEFENEETVKIHLRSMANGIYYLKVNTSGHSLNKKIIKN